MKKIKMIWKRFLLWIGAAAMLLSAGCTKRETAAEPTMQLDMVQMVETAKENAEAPTGVDAINLYETLGAPEHCTEELVSEKGWLTVHLDADVILPDTALPIVRLEPREITMDDVQHYAAVLFDPEAKYVDKNDKTKGYWKLLVDELQTDIDHWDEYGKTKWDMKYETLEIAKAELAERIANMESAPESMQEITPVFEWKYSTAIHASGETTQEPYFELYTTKDDAHIFALQVHDTHIGYHRGDRAVYGIQSQRKSDVSAHMHISQEDAFAIAERTVKELGIDGMTCTYQAGYVSHHQPYWYGYDFIYERVVNGVPVTFVNHGNDRTGREFVYINVDDDGVTTLDYHFPNGIAAYITESATLLPFDQIKAVFDLMVMVVDNQTESAAWNRAGMPNLTADYHIGEIRLGLAPVEESGHTGKCLLVPAWDFLGYNTAAVDGKDQWIHDTNEKTSFLTINAVDGTIIDRMG